MAAGEEGGGTLTNKGPVDAGGKRTATVISGEEREMRSALSPSPEEERGTTSPILRSEGRGGRNSFLTNW